MIHYTNVRSTRRFKFFGGVSIQKFIASDEGKAFLKKWGGLIQLMLTDTPFNILKALVSSLVSVSFCLFVHYIILYQGVLTENDYFPKEDIAMIVAFWVELCAPSGWIIARVNPLYWPLWVHALRERNMWVEPTPFIVTMENKHTKNNGLQKGLINTYFMYVVASKKADAGYRHPKTCPLVPWNEMSSNRNQMNKIPKYVLSSLSLVLYICICLSLSFSIYVVVPYTSDVWPTTS
jgi:hypothetical protein